jgi:hypothetical protein
MLGKQFELLRKSSSGGKFKNRQFLLLLLFSRKFLAGHPDSQFWFILMGPLTSYRAVGWVFRWN